MDSENADSVQSGASGTELDVVTIEVEHLGAAKDGHVLKLSLSDSGAVVSNDDKLGLSVSQHLHDGLVAYNSKKKNGALEIKTTNC